MGSDEFSPAASRWVSNNLEAAVVEDKEETKMERRRKENMSRLYQLVLERERR